jgi:hypothetical protein
VADWFAMKRRTLLKSALAGFHSGALAAQAASADILAQHDYDAVTDAVVSWQLRPGDSVTQSFALEPGIHQIGGFRIKLMRWGNPAKLGYRLGTRFGSADIISGSLDGSKASSWFEHWFGEDFPTPHRVNGGRYYLQLLLPASSPGWYEVFGTASQKIDSPNFLERFQYTRTWSPERLDGDIFENPANLDYGVRTPRYQAGSTMDTNGVEIEGLDVAFQIRGTAPASTRCEERFSFIEEITGPLYTRSSRDASAIRGAGEIAIEDGWILTYSSQTGDVVTNRIREFRQFLQIAMSVRTDLKRSEQLLQDHKTFVVGTRRELADEGKDLRKTESFRLSVRGDKVLLCGYDERGILLGLHCVEASMRLRRAPFLKVGEETRVPAHSPRITCAPFYCRAELEVPVDPYTDGLLGRVARAGFNAIWFWCDLDAVAHSNVYPELDDGVRERQARLNTIVHRAERHGLDVYMYLANRPLPASFFDRHPQVKGSERNAYGGNYILCTSGPEARKHLGTAVQDLMQNVPKLRGIVLIIGGEGFFHCYTRENTCPRCSRRTPQEIIAEFSEAILTGARAGNPNAAVVLWPYSASNHWSQDDITQSKLIDKLPAGITFMTEFAKEGTISFGDVTIPAYDYPISLVGPSERFVQQAKLVKTKGLDFWVKTEHAIALEFVPTPYIPVFFQWAERFERIRQSSQISGVFSNWMHYGFTPSIAADLYFWHIWSHPPDAAELLGKIAHRDFGASSAPHVVKAWRAFSEAIRQYPFSGSVAMGVVQKGPAHPLFFSPEYKPRHGSGRQFRNDLSWTKPWGPELTIRQFSRMEKLWSAGVAELEMAGTKAEPEARRNIERELGICRTLLACVRSAIHVARFYTLRDELFTTSDRSRASALLGEMISVARAELKNGQEALPFVCADSRLGYANSGKSEQIGVPRAGIYSAGSIRKKIAQVQRLLDEDIPEYRRHRGLAAI